jgi:hypothetical protein
MSAILAEALALTIERCDAWLERELEAAEITLLDLGASLEEVENAIGAHGYVRRMLQADRDAQIAEVTRLLSGDSATLH